VKLNFKMFAVVMLSVLAALVLRSDRGHGQSGQQYPVIIRQISMQNQTITPPVITLFTPTTSGLYRVSAYFSIFPESTGSICPQVEWLDASAQQDWDISLTTCAYPGNNGNGVVILHSIPNEPVNLIPNFESFTGGYNLFVTVEQLQ
jgi:hypothetical protein